MPSRRALWSRMDERLCEPKTVKRLSGLSFVLALGAFLLPFWGVFLGFANMVAAFRLEKRGGGWPATAGALISMVAASFQLIIVLGSIALFVLDIGTAVRANAEARRIACGSSPCLFSDVTDWPWLLEFGYDTPLAHVKTRCTRMFVLVGPFSCVKVSETPWPDGPRPIPVEKPPRR